MGFANVVMLNPVLLSKSGAYETEEGLSLIHILISQTARKICDLIDT